ncbi:MAG: peptidoglycan-binding protein [Parcubacteria group bacterium]|nr:peptidoglycan-binding protein [Parcubacteria group bacterium]
MRFVLSSFVALSLFISGFVTVPASAQAALSESQIQAIISLVASFGADAATVQNVGASLRGHAPTGSSSSSAGGTSTSASSCISLSFDLYLDRADAQTNGEVTKLQKFLAQNSSIYPEGRITGYFGPATERALQRWQAARGVVSSGDADTTGYGYAGPKTRAAMACGGSAQTVVPPTPSVQPQPAANSSSPTITTFYASPASVSSGDSVTLSWSASNTGACGISSISTGAPDVDLSKATINYSTGVTSVVIGPLTQNATYELRCAPHTGIGGAYAIRQVTVTVANAYVPPPTPTTTFQASPSTILVGQVATLSWSSSNANRCFVQSGSLYEPWTEIVSMNGSKTVSPSQTTSYKLGCTNDPGTGKDGPSAEKTVTVYVTNPTHVFNGTGVQINSGSNAAAYMAAVNVAPGNSFTLSGTASVSGPLTVALVEIKYAGGKDWSSVGNIVKGGSGYLAVSNSASISGGNWSTLFGGLSEGYYHILIYDASFNLVGSGFLTSTSKG